MRTCARVARVARERASKARMRGNRSSNTNHGRGNDGGDGALLGALVLVALSGDCGNLGSILGQSWGMSRGHARAILAVPDGLDGAMMATWAIFLVRVRYSIATF